MSDGDPKNAARGEVVVSAASVSVALCANCDAVHIDLLDADGRLYATAACPADEDWIEAFVAGIRSKAAQARARRCQHGPVTAALQ